MEGVGRDHHDAHSSDAVLVVMKPAAEARAHGLHAHGPAERRVDGLERVDGAHAVLARMGERRPLGVDFGGGGCVHTTGHAIAQRVSRPAAEGIR